MRVTVVSPEVLKRWRKIGTPEPIIERIIEHKKWAREQREKDRGNWFTLPDFKYKMPPLPLLEEKPEVYARATDCDGWVIVRERRGRDRISRVDRIVYRYEYYRPSINFGSTTYELVEDYARALRVGRILPTRYKPPRVVIYTTRALGSRAVHATYLMEPYLIKWREHAEQILTIYRERPEIRVE